MLKFPSKVVNFWLELGPGYLPFADAASRDLPLKRLLRLALFQVSVGMATVLLTGTLNRVMIIEMHVPATLVALMVSLPLLFAPLRALIGFRSDTHRSFLGWRRVPYIWMGTMLQFAGLSIMPFALILLSGISDAPAYVGQLGAGLAFLLVGAGLHTTQTAGLALATDIAPEESRGRVVALLYLMLLLGTVLSALIFGMVLDEYTPLRLIQVIQACAVLTMALNCVALWQQEVRNPALTAPDKHRPGFRAAWGRYASTGQARRFLLAVGLGTAAFSMQDVLLEPYGAEVLQLGVGATTRLTALLAAGTLVAFAVAARLLARGADPYRLAATGALLGLPAFAAVIFAAPAASLELFCAGAALIGFGSGLFAVGMLMAVMAMETGGQTGLALGAWGAVQATAAGGAIALGGTLRDLFAGFAARGTLGPAFSGPSVSYSIVYAVEIVLLFLALVAVGPLVRRRNTHASAPVSRFGLAEFPG